MANELHTFDRMGMEQVKRYVREEMRRVRGGQLFPGRWHKKGGNGTGSSCCCTCVCEEPNLQHPGGFLTMRHWTIPLSTSAWARATNDNGHIRVKAGSYQFSWDTTDERWEYTLTTSDVDWRNDNDEISVPTTVTGSAYMDWTSTTDPVVIRVDFDATGNIYVPFP